MEASEPFLMWKIIYEEVQIELKLTQIIKDGNLTEVLKQNCCYQIL